MKRTLLLLAALVALPNTAQALDPLLVEFTQRGSYSASGDLPLVFTACPSITGPQGCGQLGGNYVPTDQGQTFYAAPAELAKMATSFRTPGGYIYVSTVTSDFGAEVDAAIWHTDDVATTFVPRLGHGLAGYDVTAVAQTIDRLEFDVQCGGLCYSTGYGAQTVRVYGVPIVPEPGGLAMLMVAVHIMALARPACARRSWNRS